MRRLEQTTLQTCCVFLRTWASVVPAYLNVLSIRVFVYSVISASMRAVHLIAIFKALLPTQSF